MQQITAEELLALPEGKCRHELVRGELRSMSFHGWRHGVVATRIGCSIANLVKAQRLGVVFAGGTGFLLERRPDTVLAADVSFVSAARMAAENGPGFFPGSPDLAVEVLSPSDTGPEVRDKVGQWLQSGCRMVWIVDPERRRGEAHRPDGSVEVIAEDGVFSGGDVVTGLRLRLGEMLAG